MNNYHKTIVCDIDDTISFTTDRDWENATPNTQLIQKLNKLYDEGWTICYVTARGNVSFKGDREAADKHYRPIIEKWFKKNNVKYSMLSFDKMLAAYYIDDKAATPESFMDIHIEKLIGGLSGADIERRGNLVYKTHPNSLESAVWFKEASNIVKTAKVHSLIGNTLCLEYIEKTDEPKIEQIDYIINQFRTVPSSEDFSTYIDRIKDHLSIYEPEYKEALLKTLKDREETFNLNKSFCHGDMSLDNMINNNGVLYLIDPNKPKGLYSSWLLDVSKVLHSARRFNHPQVYSYFINKYKELKQEIQLLELTHWVRMRKYNEDKEFVDKNIQDILKEIRS